MSDTISTFTNQSAKRYNKRFAGITTMPGIPDIIKDAYPGINQLPETFEFAEAVFRIQRDLGLQSDGCLGPATYRAILEEYDPVLPAENYIVFGQRRIALDGLSGKSYYTLNFDQADGLDLHPAGHFSSRSIAPDTVIMHWGGFNPKSLYNVMSGPRKVSTHFGIGLDSAGQPYVVQYLDLKHKAWHAGSDNEGSIGIDICQQPVYKHIGRYQKEGYVVKKMKNPTTRGNRNVISLDPRIAQATRDFVLDLANVLDLRLKSPKTHELLDNPRDYTLVGHHHLSGRKWDIACWWNTVFQDTQFTIENES
tara:strand:+ start:3080 stop:4003 length:924 start_codon:yes stop_codon:yes gene_type:complete